MSDNDNNNNNNNIANGCDTGDTAGMFLCCMQIQKKTITFYRISSKGLKLRGNNIVYMCVTKLRGNNITYMCVHSSAHAVNSKVHDMIY